MSDEGIPRYWGIYFPKDDAWLKHGDGDFFYWPSPYVAAAKLRDMGSVWADSEPIVKEFDGTILNTERP